ncbi:MAG: FHA domain-containing protein [Rivularia sp. (in: cyanobacteria)]
MMKVKISTSPTQSELEEIDLSSTTRKGAECIIGRSPDSDVVLDSNDVSRYHGKFFYYSGNYYFSDLGSKNGSIINGKLLEKNHSQILKDGDLIRIGDFALILEEDIVFSQQSETVVKIINPSMFSNWQDRPDAKSNPVNQPQEVPESKVSEAIPNRTPVAEENNNGEKVNIPEESTFVQSGEAIPENSAEENIFEIVSQTPEVTPESEDINLEDNSDDDAEEIAAQTPEVTPESEPQSEMMEVNTSEDIDINMPNTEELGEELVSEIASIATSELVDEDSEEIDEENQQDSEESIIEEESVIKIAQVLEEKRIVLISHETKKSELKELVIEHEEFLSYCQTVTWQTYNDYLCRETGLNVTEDIPPATSGGYQAINSLINSEKVIAVIFLRNLTAPQPGQASEEALLRTCNIREILLANNLPTAQAVVNYLKHMKD